MLPADRSISIQTSTGEEIANVGDFIIEMDLTEFIVLDVELLRKRYEEASK